MTTTDIVPSLTHASRHAVGGPDPLTVSAIGAQPALTVVASQTGNVTAAAYQFIPCNANAAAFTVTLPSAPANGARVAVKKTDSSTFVVTVACAGSDVFNKAGGSTTLTLQTVNQMFTLQYATTGGIWYVDDSPSLGALDTRFVQASTVGAASGVASLDSAGLVPVAQLPLTTQSLVIPGTGIPSSSVGANGDNFLDYASGNLYLKTSGSWGSPVATLATSSAAGAIPAIGVFAATTAYATNQLVTYAGGLYQSLSNFTSGASFVASNWNHLSDIATADVQVFTTSGTWTKPVNGKTTMVFMIGSGAGGGAGSRYASGQVPTGGSGGGGAGVTSYTVPTSALTSTVAVTVGVGGAGGASVTTDSTAGAGGTSGTPTTFGSYARADKGFGGGPSGNAVAATVGPGGGGGTVNGGGGSASSVSGSSGPGGANAPGGPGGGAGGGITSGVSASTGGTGGYAAGVSTAGATGGTVGAGQNGQAGASQTSLNLPGGGGAGGASNTTAAAGTGGVGGAYGGGGGGGGASLNGFASGAGGQGGPGVCVVVTHF